MIRFQLFVLVVLFAGQSALTQEKSCRIDLPVGIISPDGSLLNGLTARDITVSLHKRTLPIEMVGYETGPRRVLFILDTSRLLPVEARKVQTMLVSYVLSNARPVDSFALLTTRGAKRQVRFQDSQVSLMKTIDELAADPKEQEKAQNVLDTVMEGIQWFGEPRIGDAILLMADHLEESIDPVQYQSRELSHTGPLQGILTDRRESFEAPSHFGFKKVVEALADHRIRMFGLQLGAMKMTPLTAVYSPNDENLFGITRGSGGYAVLDPLDPFGGYVVNDARAQSLRHKVFQLYGAIAQFYTLRINAQVPPTSESWSLELARDLQKNTIALYPRKFDPCASR